MTLQQGIIVAEIQGQATRGTNRMKKEPPFPAIEKRGKPQLSSLLVNLSGKHQS
jgi:hypothetical protein